MHALSWRAERAFLKAWPALAASLHRDWQARFANGLSRRANSVNPLIAGATLGGADIRFFEDIYRTKNLPLIFRVPTLLNADADLVLSRSGFVQEGECHVLYGAMDAVTAQPDSGVEIHAAPTREWFDAIHAANSRASDQRPTYETIINAVALPSGFAALRDNGQPVAMAYAAIDGDLLCVESVVTFPSHRGKGYAKRLIAALAHWAKARDAATACLQVEATNGPALALYRQLGLGNELYRYHYRRQPAQVAVVKTRNA